MDITDLLGLELQVKGSDQVESGSKLSQSGVLHEFLDEFLEVHDVE
jgi:hypothetical protein